MNVPTQSSVPPPPMAPAPQKKGLSPLAWVGIGCGAIVVLGMIGFGVFAFWVKNKVTDYAEKAEKNPAVAAAELIVAASPDFEVIESDVDAGTLRIRNTETGEEMTMNAADIQKEGKITFTTKEGTATFDASGGEGGVVEVTNEKGEVATFQAGEGAPKNLPSWLPIYPGGTAQGSFDSDTAEERAAAFSMTTKEPADKVLSFYEEKLKEAGFTVQKNTFTTNDKLSGGVLNGNSADGKRQVGITVSVGDDGTTQAAVTFSEKKG